MTEESEFALRLIIGIVLGSFPIFRGAKNRRLIWGILGFFACIISMDYGLIVAIPVCAIFVALTREKQSY